MLNAKCINHVHEYEHECKVRSRNKLETVAVNETEGFNDEAQLTFDLHMRTCQIME